jgi:quinol monooxygenase YgiN
MLAVVIILAGTIRFTSDNRIAVINTLERLIQATCAEAGCIAYSFAFDVLDNQLLRIFEVFQDEAALATHRASPHMAEARAAFASLGFSDRDLWQYEAVSSRRA